MSAEWMSGAWYANERREGEKRTVVGECSSYTILGYAPVRRGLYRVGGPLLLLRHVSVVGSLMCCCLSYHIGKSLVKAAPCPLLSPTSPAA